MELKERDWRAFYDLAKAAVADEPNSRANVFDRSGQLVLSTILPYGTLLPVTAAPEAINKVVETRQAYVSDLFTGSVSNEVPGGGVCPSHRKRCSGLRPQLRLVS